MSIETEIQTEVDALKARFEDTKALYREVCALLFFRHGITPTTNKLYQFVRKGSMSAPADALTKFWDELRNKARIEIDHPDLPVEVKEAAASAIAAVWRQASAAAREELHSLRMEVSAHLVTAQDERNAAVRSAEQLHHANEGLANQIGAAQAAAAAIQADLESERRAHAATSARLLELQRTCDGLRSQQLQLQEGFSSDLAKARAAIDDANSRSDAFERRSLLEIDQERQARSRSEKALESIRVQAAQTEDRLRTEAQAAVEASVRQAAKIESLEVANQALSAEMLGTRQSLDGLRARLIDAEAAAARASAEAHTLQSVLDRFSAPPAAPVSPPAGSPSPKVGKSRKSGA